MVKDADGLNLTGLTRGVNDLAARARGSANDRPGDTIFANYGDNWLKFRVRSHPDVAAIHHPDLVGKYD